MLSKSMKMVQKQCKKHRPWKKYSNLIIVHLMKHLFIFQKQMTRLKHWIL